MKMLSWFRNRIQKTIQIGELHLEPGDVVVLKTEQYLSRVGSERLKKAVEHAIDAAENRVVILDGGASLDIIRKRNTEPPQPLDVELLKNGQPCIGPTVFKIGDEISVRFVEHKALPEPTPGEIFGCGPSRPFP